MVVKNESQAAILKTLAYADIFTYPLRESEINRYLISSKNTSENKIHLNLLILIDRGLVENFNGFYCLAGRKNIITTRLKRNSISLKKKQIANKISKLFKLFPWVRAVAITGALSMNNAEDLDDIDLMIITAPNRLWLTRMTITLFLPLFYKRRHPQDYHRSTNFKNHVCLNLFLDENNLSVPKKMRNLYTAHEVVQSDFIYEKDNIGHRFLIKNHWVKTYLAHTQATCDEKTSIKNGISQKPTQFFLKTSALIDFLESFVYKQQKEYMQKKITREVVDAQRAFFHPRNTPQIVLEKYEKRLSRFNLE